MANTSTGFLIPNLPEKMTLSPDTCFAIGIPGETKSFHIKAKNLPFGGGALFQKGYTLYPYVAGTVENPTMYAEQEVLVLYTDGELYRLNYAPATGAARPFGSTDFAAEITSGYWVPVSAGVNAEDLALYTTKVYVDDLVAGLVANGGSVVTGSTINGNVVVNGTEVTVYNDAALRQLIADTAAANGDSVAKSLQNGYILINGAETLVFNDEHLLRRQEGGTGDKFLNDRNEYIRINPFNPAGGSGDRITWIRPPFLRVDTGNVVVVTNSDELTPLAEWPGKTVNYANGPINHDFSDRTPGDGLVSADTIFVTTEGFYEVQKGERGSFPNLPSIPNNRLVAGYVIWGASSGSILYPENYATKEELDAAIAAIHTHANKSALDKIIDSGTGGKFLADDGNYYPVSGTTGEALQTLYSVRGQQTDGAPTNKLLDDELLNLANLYQTKGNYSIVGHTHALSSLSDVNVTAVTEGQVIKYIGGTWTAADDVAGDSTSGLTKAEADTYYQPIGAYLTQVDTDALYQPKGSYLPLSFTTGQQVATNGYTLSFQHAGKADLNNANIIHQGNQQFSSTGGFNDFRRSTEGTYQIETQVTSTIGYGTGSVLHSLSREFTANATDSASATVGGLARVRAFANKTNGTVELEATKRNGNVTGKLTVSPSDVSFNGVSLLGQGSTITDSATNGNIVVDGSEITVWDNSGAFTQAAADALYQPKGNYEPAFSKLSAFNKNFGILAGTVAEGNHLHDDRYVLLANTPLKVGGLQAGYEALYSFDNDSAGGMRSIALGSSSQAWGNYSTSIGSGTQASHDYSVAMGRGTYSAGVASFSIGDGTSAEADASMATGNGTRATGGSSHASGYYTEAWGFGSYSGGAGQATGETVLATGLASFNHSEVTAAAPVGLVGAAAANSAILGGVNNQLLSTALRSVILGGSGITGNAADTVYTPNIVVNGTILKADGTPYFENDGTGVYALSELNDVDFAIAPTAGQVLKFDGTKWKPAADLTGDSTSGLTKAEADTYYQPIGNYQPAGDYSLVGHTHSEYLTTTSAAETYQPKGNYSIVGHTHALQTLSDVTTTALATGHYIRWDGTKFVNGPLPASVGSVSDSVTNGNIVVDGSEITVWDNTGAFTQADADLLYQPKGDYSIVGHTHDEYLTQPEGDLLYQPVGNYQPAGSYEPSFSKNTGFNKNFGTTLGTVSEGNHSHTFAQITSKPTTLGGFGITDAYTKSNTYSRTEAYSKTEIDALLKRTPQTLTDGALVTFNLSAGYNANLTTTLIEAIAVTSNPGDDGRVLISGGAGRTVSFDAAFTNLDPDGNPAASVVLPSSGLCYLVMYHKDATTKIWSVATATASGSTIDAYTKAESNALYLKYTEAAAISLRANGKEYFETLTDRIRFGFQTGADIYSGNYSAYDRLVTAGAAGAYGESYHQTNATNNGKVVHSSNINGGGTGEVKDYIELNTDAFYAYVDDHKAVDLNKTTPGPELGIYKRVTLWDKASNDTIELLSHMNTSPTESENRIEHRYTFKPAGSEANQVVNRFELDQRGFTYNEHNVMVNLPPVELPVPATGSAYDVDLRERRIFTLTAPAGGFSFNFLNNFTGREAKIHITNCSGQALTLTPVSTVEMPHSHRVAGVGEASTITLPASGDLMVEVTLIKGGKTLWKTTVY